MSLLLDRLLSVALADGGTGTLPPHAALDSPRRACVAILLRVPVPPTSLSQEAQQFDDLAALRRWLEAQPAPARPDAEVLFIRRALNPRDRWSGQVAFPGGRSAPGEDDRSCVEREFREELGVDLGNGARFRCLGQLADRLVRTRAPFAVATFVYLDMAVGAPLEFRLASAEVAEAFWTPASLLTGPRSQLQCLQLHLDRLSIPAASPAVRLARLLGVTALAFPCLDLDGSSASGVSPDYALWGLSLGIVSDLLKTAGLPSIGARRPTELRAAHPGLSRRAALPFLTDSRVMNALLPAYFGPPGQGRLVLWAVGGAVGAALVSVGWLASQRRARL